MPHSTTLNNPIRRLQYKVEDGEVPTACPVQVVPMTLRHALYWHQHVQSKIDLLYVKETARKPS
jgi:hypothetical protein